MSLLVLVLAASPAQWLGPPPPTPAMRIISLAPSITQTVLALGGRHALIAVSRFCDFPEVAKLPRAGGFNDISVETIIALKPQLLVVAKSPGNQKAVETLARLGIPVLALPLTTVDDVATSMTELGHVLGRDAATTILVGELAAARVKEREVVRRSRRWCSSWWASLRWWWRGRAASRTSCWKTAGRRTPRSRRDEEGEVGHHSDESPASARPRAGEGAAVAVRDRSLDALNWIQREPTPLGRGERAVEAQ